MSTGSSSAKQNCDVKSDPDTTGSPEHGAEEEEVENSRERTEETDENEEQNDGDGGNEEDNGVGGVETTIAERTDETEVKLEPNNDDDESEEDEENDGEEEEAPAPTTPSSAAVNPVPPHLGHIQPPPFFPPYWYPMPGSIPMDFGSVTSSQLYTDRSTMPDPTPDTRRNRGGVTEPFPERLHRMLETTEREGVADVVSWFSHGRCFAIHKPRRFVEEIMPRFFRQTKLTSFQRQLNLYGFRRVSQGPDNGGYYHEMFLKGRPGLSVNMKRTKVKGDNKAKRDPDTEPNFYIMRPIMTSPTATLMPGVAPLQPQASPGSTAGTSQTPAPGTVPSQNPYPPLPPYGYPGYQFPTTQPPYTAAQQASQAPMYPGYGYPGYMYPGAWGPPPGGYPPQMATAPTTPHKEGDTAAPADEEASPATGGERDDRAEAV